MSAIWGAINLNKEMIPDSVSCYMRKAFDKCRIDRYEELKDKNIYLGCGIQYFIPEAEKEQLPYSSNGIYFDADVVLDNRQDLYEMLEMTKEEGEKLPDGKILYEVFKRKGKECLNDLLGAYTFIWYDAEQGKLEMVLDAVGNRCLYYTKIGSIVCFSSLMEPFVQIREEVRLNDGWFTDFLGLDGVIMFNDTESTPFENIYRVAPAQYICIHADGRMEKELYWNPFNNESIYHYKTDEEYQEMYLSIWSKAVEDTLRAQKHSILLSGGFDSTAVAAIAAPYLKKRNEKLYSYTSVPTEGYQVDTSGRYIEDESEDVKKTAEYYGNIETTFLALNQVDPWNESQKVMSIFEFPYKSVQNCLWIMEAMKQAYENGSRIMLTGGYGNISISYGGMEVYANTLYKNGQKRKLKEELTKFSQRRPFSVEYVYKLIEKTFREEYTKTLDLYRDSFVNRDLAEEMGTTERLENIEKRIWLDKRDERSALHSNIHWVAMRQIGEMQTKQSLVTGVLQRDPTCDKRILEFCVRLPISQYSKDGIDRRLVRVYMKELMPLHVLEERGIGSQSADIQYRMEKNWKQIRETWLGIYQKYADSKYVAIPYARQQLLDNEDIDCYEQFDLVRQMYTVFALQYEGYVRKHYGRKEQQDLPDIQFGNIDSLISVVIYVHNDEEWLSECIKSVAEQTYSNIEILLFEDKSEDKSAVLCDEWAIKDNRITVIHQEYRGEYAVYKRAIQMAKGKWMAFLKGSDSVGKDFYFELHKRAEENEADLVCCELNADTKGQQMRLYYDKNILYQYMSGRKHTNLPQEIHYYLYRKDILQHIDLRVNDRVWNYKVMEQAHKCICICTNKFALESRTLQKEQDVTEILAENRMRLEMADKYFTKEFYEKALWEYYQMLLEIYYKDDRYDKASRRMVKAELEKQKKAVRAILSHVYCGRKKKLQTWISTI